ncbi:Transcription factor tau subunit sfc1 [Schizosaccharomyces pombe]|uniref:Transcription factor tau subunit sfc1 n=1 Tax=Schizosaccharomyces pombe (strain 972 / ATCC 24843) TaxID=284812 RepID=SFC1_SCHPO|nr:transcription factor TFIIIC subunit Sfc1 [Schizosaccharomyces pombe]O14229.2 RecName: Full=Transcription factor tau subunit sfc1; AltName: Full=TFIIIC subunit sfc1; AltName: Full=Transcription factor C subunit 1 [Schizosaccharomyces pombe 972h-]CAB11095.2 transcription factor TFIIIC complex A box associated subunit Sfc1 [Schizosaccharomyces pombe]|eukprot:NP_593297.1 transcription factor TFIIIC subunit Sfc1 [Schizosaccharomyces pombe]
MNSLKISDNEYALIEHPGFANNKDAFFQTLGGVQSIQKACQTSFQNPKQALLELNLRPKDKYHHPVQARVQSRNDLLVTIKKMDNSVQNVSRIRQVFLFRDMADFQYSTQNSPFVQKLDSTLRVLDYNAINKFSIDLTPVQRKHVDMPPPPVFSQTSLPMSYNFLQNPLVGRVRLPNGKTTIVNLKGQCRVWIITTNMGVESVPTCRHSKLGEPSKTIQEVIEALKPLFEKRPVWTRRALLNHLDPSYTHYLKFALPYLSYLWTSGPFRDTYTRFGYDPRKDSNAAAYQALFFKLKLNGKHKGTKTHVFDGKTLFPTNRVYQVCDIVDPTIAPLLKDTQLRSECHRDTGWYRSGRYYKVRDLMREKLFALIEGEMPSEVAVNMILNAEEVEESDRYSNFDEQDNTDLNDTVRGLNTSATDDRINDLMRNLMKRSQEHEGFEDLEEIDDDYDDIFGD